MTMEVDIKRWRNDMSTVGLYYAEDVARHMVEQEVPLPEGSNPDQWVMVQGFKDMMSALDKINMESIIESLMELKDQSQVIRYRGEYAVKVLDKNGEETEAAKCLAEIMAALSDYPVLDDQAYSQWEYDNQLSIIRDTARNLHDDLPDNWDEQVWRFIWDHESWAFDRATDEGWIDPDHIQRAIEALGFNEEEGE